MPCHDETRECLKKFVPEPAMELVVKASDDKFAVRSVEALGSFPQTSRHFRPNDVELGHASSRIAA
jgi:hypothetical protein